MADEWRDARTHWNERYADRERHAEPLAFITESAHLLPALGRAVDIGGGTGRHALWLASHGLDTTLIDVSDVALDMAVTEAKGRALTLDLVRRDVEADGLPEGTWDVVIITFFQVRNVLRDLPHLLEPGGLALVCHTTMRNLERHPRPGMLHLLDDGELARVAASWAGMEIIDLDEGWMPEGRHEARLRARRAR